MEVKSKMASVLKVLPWLNVFAAIICFASAAGNIAQGRGLFATLLIVVGVANVWRVYSRIPKQSSQ
jgi:hypothetical protein